MGIKKGFTFIEMVVVIGVIGLTLPALFAIILVILQQQTKIIRLSEVKRQGDYVFSVMENTIRNYALSTHTGYLATDANQVCASTNLSPTAFSYFKDNINSNTFGFILSSNKIASRSSIMATTDLTSAKVVVSNLSFICTRNNEFSPPLTFISFDICYNVGSGSCASTRPEETATLHYQTAIKLRSY